MDKILIVDGNERNIDLISRSIFTAKYDIYTATTGKIAFAKINAINPDLIIMDTDLPDGSGFDICKKLKLNNENETKYIPVLMLITAETKNTVLRCFYAGADDYMIKLFNSTVLLSKIKSLLRVKHLSDQIKTQYSELKEKNELLSFQLKMARQVQRSIIKKIDIKNDKVNILSKYLPALEIGGDFYSIYEFDSNRIGIIMGDVSGHGISAALLTTMLSMMFNTFAPQYVKPSDLLKKLNIQFHNIFENTANNMYACMFYAIIDLNLFNITYSNAGQSFPVYINIKEDEITASELELGGMPIGLIKDAEYENKVLEYNAGDFLFMHTDGLSDFFYKEKPEEFITKLKNNLISCVKNGFTLDESIDNILNEFYYYDENKKFENDDVSMIICKL